MHGSGGFEVDFEAAAQEADVSKDAEENFSKYLFDDRNSVL